MASWSALSFGGWDPLGSYFESEHNEKYNQRAIDYQAKINKELAQWSAENLPSMQVKGYEDAGLNPILMAGGSASSAGSVSALSSPSSSHASAGNPLEIALTRAHIAQSNSAKNSQDALAELYRANAKRMKYIPLTETDSGGGSILGTGLQFGGSDTLLFDVDKGEVIRPKGDVFPNNKHSAGDYPSVFKQLENQKDKPKSKQVLPFNFTVSPYL